ncbi:hypothetical protein DL95DRAFT_522023 [Leptodontidium sp. 2 PMI_412]|nr:hypothetical protein DL95DRAFT_522023 [Leptodontidium sp. 2 PMI_412]
MAILIEDHPSSSLSPAPPKAESCNKSPLPSSQPSLPTSCTICHSPFNTPHQDGIFETPSILPCAHIFGSLCIKRWLESSKHKDCPNCRREMRYVGCGHAVIPKSISISTSKSTSWNRDGVGIGRGSDGPPSLMAVKREDMPALCLLCRESREMEEVVRRAEERLAAEKRALEGLRGALPGLFGGLYKGSGNGMGMMDFEERTGEVRGTWKSEMEILTEGLRGRMEGKEDW